MAQAKKAKDEDEEMKLKAAPSNEEAEVEKDAETDEEEDEESDADTKKKKKSANKKELLKGEGVNPDESAAESMTAEHSTTPGAGQGVPTKQNVFVPPSSATPARTQDSYYDHPSSTAKSASPELLKSPLFVNLSEQIDGIRDTISKKLGSVEKSVNDRLSNIEKDMKAVEKFYGQSFHKSITEEAGAEAIAPKPFSKKLDDGEVRFRK